MAVQVIVSLLIAHHLAQGSCLHTGAAAAPAVVRLGLSRYKLDLYVSVIDASAGFGILQAPSPLHLSGDQRSGCDDDRPDPGTPAFVSYTPAFLATLASAFAW
jgi:hypothetical protein